MSLDVSTPFRPAVPVFDGNAALGRRHDRRVALDTPAALLAEMDRCGIGRALVHHPHASNYCTREGNAWLMELVAGYPRLMPQWVVSPVFDAPEDAGAALLAAGVRSVRMCPRGNMYLFKRWTAGAWLEWLQAHGLALWLPAEDVDLGDLHDTLQHFAGLRVVLVAPTYAQISSVLPLARVLPNLFVDLSRWDVFRGPARLRDAIGAGRLLYGSNLPEFEPGSMLYYLHHCGFDERELRAVCGGNLERLVSDQ